jgi:hypothetical protein
MWASFAKLFVDPDKMDMAKNPFMRSDFVIEIIKAKEKKEK